MVTDLCVRVGVRMSVSGFVCACGCECGRMSVGGGVSVAY